MRRIFLLLAAAAILLAACGGAATVSTTSEELSSGTVPATPAPSVDDQPGGDETETTSADETSADETATDATPAVDDEPVVARVTDFDGPAAADFTIDLNKTGTFTLSEEARPVYLVFWAEW